MMILEKISDPLLGQTFLGNVENIGTILIRIFIVVLFASLFGIERSQKRHAAGLRTFILVSLFSVCGAILDQWLMEHAGSTIPFISVAVIIGIAIISANTMLYSSKSQIKGLTTAVALWCSSFIGITIGLGLYSVGFVGFVVLMLSLNALPSLEIFLKNRSSHFEIHLELKKKDDLPNFLHIIRELGLRVDEIEANPAYQNSGLAAYSISLTVISEELKKYKTHYEIIESLKSIDSINSIEEINY